MRKYLVFSILIYLLCLLPSRAAELYEMVEIKCARDMGYFSWRSVSEIGAFKLGTMTEALIEELETIGVEGKLNQYGFSTIPETTCELGNTDLDRRVIEIRDVTPGGWKGRHPNSVDMELVVDGHSILKMDAIWGVRGRDDQHYIEIWGSRGIHCVQSFGENEEQSQIAATETPLEFVSHTQRCRRFELNPKNQKEELR